MTEGVVIGCALGSALAASTASVLQHHSARRAPRAKESGYHLLVHLLASPPWLAGLLAATIGLALHAVALAAGQLAVVQPLLVCGLLFALPVSLMLEGRRTSLNEGGWALVLVCALTGFLLTAHPRGGTVSPDADSLAWATIAACAAIVMAIACGSRWPRHRAAILATAAGLGYGVAAALLKQTTAIASGGFVAVVADWPVYALITVGGFALGLTQVAYRSGPLAESLPTITIIDPASSIVIGALAFHEQLAHSAAAVTIEIAAFALMGLAAARLAR